MRYIYNSNERMLRDLLYYNKGNGIVTHKPIYLNNLEGKLLLFLSDQQFHTYEDICKFLYKHEIVSCRNAKGKIRIIDKKTAVRRIRITSHRMLNKIKPFEVRIKCKRNVGITLISKEKIWIE